VSLFGSANLDARIQVVRSKEIERKKQGVKRRWRRCGWCKESFRQKRGDQLYCSAVHKANAAKARQRRKRWRICPICKEAPIMSEKGTKCLKCARVISGNERKGKSAKTGTDLARDMSPRVTFPRAATPDLEGRGA